MSSTDSPKRTDAGTVLAPSWAPAAANTIAIGLFSVAMISFQPFRMPDPTISPSAGGNIVNQLGFGTMGAVSIFALAAFVDPRRISALFGPSLLLLLGLMMLSVTNAADPSVALRTASFTLIGILTMATILALPKDADAFSTVLFTTGAVVIGLSYVGLVVFPDASIHSADSIEPQHAGLWRGVFTHKNIAGPVMACFSFCGIYVWRRGERLKGAILFTAAMIFMINTGSKATAGLVPLALIIVVVPGLYGMRLLTPILVVLALVGTGLGTLGVVFIEPLKQFAAAYYPDPTFTGRVTLWEFAGEMLAKRPWTGYGFDSFWGSALVLGSDNPFDRAWDVRAVVHGHDGYLDVAMMMGIPAVIVMGWAFFIAPLTDYVRMPVRKESVLLGDLFLMILLFTGLNAFLESFFFRRADPVWLFFIFAVIGMRLAARFPGTAPSR